MSVLGGGGLNLSVCQLVDWMFSKWSVDEWSSWSSVSLKMTSGSRMYRWATWWASGSSMPLSSRRCLTASSIGTTLSLYSGRLSGLDEMYESTLSYLDLGIRCSPGCNGCRSGG